MPRHRASARIFFLLAVVVLTGSAPLAQEPHPFAAVDRQILQEIAAHSEQMDNLRILSDRIGPRLTGTEATKRANEWAAERFRAYGLANVQLEAWTIPHAWTRGTARARVVAPANLPLPAEVAGWSPNTPGSVRGPLVYVKAEKKEDLEAYRGKLRGAIVITAAPSPRQRLPERPLEPREPRPQVDFAARLRWAGERDAFFVSEGVQGILRDSDKSFGLFNMSSQGRNFQAAPLPTAFLTPEGYDLLWRLLESKEAVEVELDISGCSFSGEAVTVYNTVAELPGNEKPEEVVLLGAHLDSWDLGTGATDNGTGVTAVLEAARALAKLNLKPKRTIRFVLFTGEEQGLHGSRAYVEAHKADLDKVSAVLVHDSGTGRVETIGIQNNPQAFEVLSQALQPLRQMLAMEVLRLDVQGGSDHASFERAGVPGFFCDQEMATYRQTHHSQADTFDKAVRDDLVNGAQVLAVFAYNVAQLDALLPRKPKPPAPAE
jgi:hypothetical protein